jgi:hypothetical protein
MTTSDWQQIVERTSAMGVLIDARDWPALTELFDERVHVDYTSLNGGEPATVTPAELIAGWRPLAEGLDATQHLIANHKVEVEGETATCSAHVLATHRLATVHGDPLWVVGGRYAFRLRRLPEHGQWRICAVTLTTFWATGNRTIMELAVQNTAAEETGDLATTRSRRS